MGRGAWRVTVHEGAESDTTEVTERAASMAYLESLQALFSHLYDSQDMTDGLRELNNGRR